MAESNTQKIEWPNDGVSRIPYKIYTDPDNYDDEQRRIFRGPIWSFVGTDQEVSKPGDFITTYIGDTPVIVLRDLERKVQVIVNRCSHRGNLICIKREGNAEELTCVYHNWRYDLQGNLKSVAFGKDRKSVV